MIDKATRYSLERRMEKTGFSPIAILLKKEINPEAVADYYKTLDIGDERSVFSDVTKELKNNPDFEWLHTIKYENYLKSWPWRIKRRLLINFYKKCMLCGSVGSIYHIHHNSYDRLGFEDWNDLIMLCENCHYCHHYGHKN